MLWASRGCAGPPGGALILERRGRGCLEDPAHLLKGQRTSSSQRRGPAQSPKAVLIFSGPGEATLGISEGQRRGPAHLPPKPEHLPKAASRVSASSKATLGIGASPKAALRVSASQCSADFSNAALRFQRGSARVSALLQSSTEAQRTFSKQYRGSAQFLRAALSLEEIALTLGEVRWFSREVR